MVCFCDEGTFFYLLSCTACLHYGSPRSLEIGFGPMGIGPPPQRSHTLQTLIRNITDINNTENINKSSFLSTNLLKKVNV